MMRDPRETRLNATFEHVMFCNSHASLHSYIFESATSPREQSSRTYITIFLMTCIAVLVSVVMKPSELLNSGCYFSLLSSLYQSFSKLVVS